MESTIVLLQAVSLIRYTPVQEMLQLPFIVGTMKTNSPFSSRKWNLEYRPGIVTVKTRMGRTKQITKHWTTMQQESMVVVQIEAP
uniref:Uncharacterized protein n=1 Tax=Nelumbo nucifera TaxID=4432 RepID=A0A822Y297_NELNU|nr:TPA_asm: hypothetical protein HUJ06_027551 [Nelumbo nucifera]